MEYSLVSIIIITYNSSKYVLETLESIYTQTYKNIELIISDDASKDDTVRVCKLWLDKNKNRFVNTELITAPINTGIPANCNRGIKKAKGEWIKIIAGDDTLKKNAIDLILKHAKNNISSEVLLTLVDVYNENFDDTSFVLSRPQNWAKLESYKSHTNSKAQLEHILRGGFHNTPGLFVKKSVFSDVGYFNEQYNFIEDVPFYLKLALKGKVISFAPIKTINYRKSINNLTSTYDKIIPVYSKQLYQSIFRASRKYGKTKYILNAIWNLIFVSIILSLGNKGIIAYSLNKVRLKLHPLRYYNLKRKLLLFLN